MDFGQPLGPDMSGSDGHTPQLVDGIPPNLEFEPNQGSSGATYGRAARTTGYQNQPAGKDSPD